MHLDLASPDCIIIQKSELIEVINTCRGCDVTETIFPTLLYTYTLLHLAAAQPNLDDPGISQDQTLLRADLERCLAAKKKLLSESKRILTAAFVFTDKMKAECIDQPSCRAGLARLKRDHANGISDTSSRSLRYHPLRNLEFYRSTCCMHCRMAASVRINDIQSKMWEKVPGYFGMPDAWKR